MAESILKIWYIKEWDTLDVGWSDRAGYFTGTDSDLVLAEVDMEGNFQGLQIEGVTQIGDDPLKVRVPLLKKTEEKAEESQKSQPKAGGTVDIAEIALTICYIKEADILAVSWSDKPSYYAATENEWVMADVDMEGNFQGFEIEGVTQLEDDVVKVRIPSPEEAREPQKNQP